MTDKRATTWGELRSWLGQPSPQHWRHIRDRLDAWPDHDERRDAVAPYCAHALDTWPQDLARPPLPGWIKAWSQGRHVELLALTHDPATPYSCLELTADLAFEVDTQEFGYRCADLPALSWVLTHTDFLARCALWAPHGSLSGQALSVSLSVFYHGRRVQRVDLDDRIVCDLEGTTLDLPAIYRTQHIWKVGTPDARLTGDLASELLPIRGRRPPWEVLRFAHADHAPRTEEIIDPGEHTS